MKISADKTLQELAQESNTNTTSILSDNLSKLISEDPSCLNQRPQLVSPKILEEIKNIVIDHMNSLGHAYHNGDHVQAVIANAKELAADAKLNKIESQLLEIAALFHDYGHAGTTYRCLNKTAKNHDLLSNEEFAACMADDIIGPYLSVPQRILLQGLILATSFGQNNLEKIPAEIQSEAYRSYRPENKLEKLLAFADISNSTKGFKIFEQESILLMEESGKNALPADFDKFLEGRFGFISYLQMKLEDVRDFLDDKSIQKYENGILELQTSISDLQNDPDRNNSPLGVAFQKIKE